MIKGKLIVQIKGAKGLSSEGADGAMVGALVLKPSSYCRVWVSSDKGNKFQTRTASNTASPTWDERAEFPIGPMPVTDTANLQLSVDVYGESFLGDFVLGRCCCSLKHLFGESKKDGLQSFSSTLRSETF